MTAVPAPIIRSRYACILLLVALTVSLARATPVQDDQSNRSLDDYDALLDSILPRDLNGTAYAFALRLMPSFRLESQLVVSVRDDGKVRAEISQVTGKSAWDALGDRLDSERTFRLADLAKAIKVEKHAIDVDLATAQRWQDSLLDASRASIDDLQRRARASRRSRDEKIWVVADGTLGELWYSQRGIDLHWGPFHVPDEDEKPNPVVHGPVARWMTEMMGTARRRLPGQ